MVNRIPAKRVFRLRAEGLSRRAIAASQRISRNSITAVYDAADQLDIDFDDIADVDDADSTLCSFQDAVNTEASSFNQTGRRYIRNSPKLG